METLVVLAVMTRGAVRQSTVKEGYTYQRRSKKLKKRTDRGKTLDQQQWEMTTGIVAPETSRKMYKRMTGIKIDCYPGSINYIEDTPTIK